MKITTKSHYGVQLMAGLAKSWGEGPVSLTAIAKSAKLSHTYLEQLMIPLRRQGLVRAQRGARGGYFLTRKPEKITLGEIIQALEGKFTPVICVSESGKPVCPSEKTCQSKKAWQKIQLGFLGTLNSISLKEATE